MKYPKFIKIFAMEDGDWCGKLNNGYFGEDQYISELISIENGNIVYREIESYPVRDLKDSGLKYTKITEREYIKFVKDKTNEYINSEIVDLQNYLKNYVAEVNQKIDKLNSEKLLMV